LASVKYGSPYHKITKTEYDKFDVDNVRALCRAIVLKYGDDMGFILDDNDELSRKLLVLLDGRNAYIVGGTDAPINDDTRIVILPSMCFA